MGLIGSIIKKGLIGLTALAAINSAYVVDQTEHAVVRNFGGKPVKAIVSYPDGVDKSIVDTLRARYSSEDIAIEEGAGLRFKIPFIQGVKKFDSRILRWNGFPEQVITDDKKYIYVDPTARWYIEDPILFLRTIGTEQGAYAKLDDNIDGIVRNEVTRRDLINVVRTNNRPMRVAEAELMETTNMGTVKDGRQKIIADITSQSAEACHQYGIGIHQAGVLFKGLTYVPAVKEGVEARMVSERDRIAKRYISEGEGAFQSIMGDKQKAVDSIESTAYETAKKIEGEADARVTDIKAIFNRDEDFYRFLRILEVYKNSVNADTKIIIGTDNPLFGQLKGRRASP